MAIIINSIRNTNSNNNSNSITNSNNSSNSNNVMAPVLRWKEQLVLVCCMFYMCFM